MELNTQATDQAAQFRRESESRRTGLAGEFYGFLRSNKKWWLLPILVLMGLLSALMLIGGSSAAPFIYTLF